MKLNFLQDFRCSRPSEFCNHESKLSFVSFFSLVISNDGLVELTMTSMFFMLHISLMDLSLLKASFSFDEGCGAVQRNCDKANARGSFVYIQKLFSSGRGY